VKNNNSYVSDILFLIHIFSKLLRIEIKGQEDFSFFVNKFNITCQIKFDN